jgi:hypothetical protein
VLLPSLRLLLLVLLPHLHGILLLRALPRGERWVFTTAKSAPSAAARAALLALLVLCLLVLLSHFSSVLLLRMSPRLLRVLLSSSSSGLRRSARSVKTCRLLGLLMSRIIEVQPLPRLQLVQRQRPRGCRCRRRRSTVSSSISVRRRPAAAAAAAFFFGVPVCHSRLARVASLRSRSSPSLFFVNLIPLRHLPVRWRWLLLLRLLLLRRLSVLLVLLRRLLPVLLVLLLLRRRRWLRRRRRLPGRSARRNYDLLGRPSSLPSLTQSAVAL